MTFSMREVREETIRQGWNLVLEHPSEYPRILTGYPNYAKKEIAERLRKRTRSWRELNGFSGEFVKMIGYYYAGRLEVEDQERKKGVDY